MTDTLKEIFDDLWQQVVGLNHKWQMYGQLYCDKDSVEVLNETANVFFATIQKIMEDDVLLGLSKLTDRAATRIGSAVYANCTLQQLQSLIDPGVHPKLFAEVAAALALVEVACSTPRIHRNKRIAHIDLDSLRSDSLPRISKADIDKALKAVCDTMQSVEGALMNSETAYDHPIVHGDGETLIFYLKLGLEREQMLKEEGLKRRTPNT